MVEQRSRPARSNELEARLDQQQPFRRNGGLSGLLSCPVSVDGLGRAQWFYLDLVDAWNWQNCAESDLFVIFRRHVRRQILNLSHP